MRAGCISLETNGSTITKTWAEPSTYVLATLETKNVTTVKPLSSNTPILVSCYFPFISMGEEKYDLWCSALRFFPNSSKSPFYTCSIYLLTCSYLLPILPARYMRTFDVVSEVNCVLRRRTRVLLPTLTPLKASTPK